MSLALHYKDSLVLERTEVCCQEFDPSEWDYAQHDWSKKLFLQIPVPGLIPGSRAKAIARMHRIAKEAKAIPEHKNALVFAHSTSLFRSELFMAVTKEVPNHKS